MPFKSRNLKKVQIEVIPKEKTVMRSVRALKHAVMVLVAGLLLLVASENAAAYVDPGTTGMLSQILYILFYGAVGMSLFFLRSIKEKLTNAKQFLAKFFGGKASSRMPSK